MLFISHKTEDKAIANEVLRRVLNRGYSDKQIFLDSDPGSGIEAGAAWERKIYESLKHTRAMIVLCSTNWLKSQWCFVELGYAKAMAISVFPIIIEKCDVGSTLSATQAIDLTTGTDAAARDVSFERLWTALEEQHLGPKDNLPWPPPGENDNCPFPGLMYFDEKHAPVFFGREQERDTVIKQLKAMRGSGVPRLLMIVGGSGSGKSSLLRAGVLPWLRHPTEQRDWLVLPTLRYGETPSDDVTLHARLAEVIADCYPQNHPQRPDWKKLRDKFEADDVEQASRDFFEATVDLRQAQRQDGSPFAAASDQAATTLLVIDQFEELLTAAARPSAQKFLRFLRILLSRSNDRLLVIGTMRSDYLDTYEQHAESLKPPFLELYRLPPFPWERVTEVIVKPAERVDVACTEELINRLKGDAPTSDALPLLAFTLEKLFRQCASDKLIELHEYEQLGGMTGAITQAVTRILPRNLPKETEQALRRTFVNHLAQVNEKDEFVRRRAQWETLPAAAKPLLEEFVRRERLLQRSGNKGELVEVTHEAIFRCWDQLKKWLQDALPVLHLRRRVEASAEEWQRSRGVANPQGDEGLLLTHAQLAALDEWLQQGDVALPDCETTFVEASREKRKSDEQRELEQARQYAEAQAARATAEAERAQEAEKNQQLAVTARRQAEQHALADKAAAERQRRLKWWAFVAAGTAVAAAIAAVLMLSSARHERDQAETAVAKGMLSSLTDNAVRSDSESWSIHLDPGEARALWDLTSTENERIRRNVFRLVLEDDILAERFSWRWNTAMQAGMGLNETRRTEFKELLSRRLEDHKQPLAYAAIEPCIDMCYELRNCPDTDFALLGARLVITRLFHRITREQYFPRDYELDDFLQRLDKPRASQIAQLLVESVESHSSLPLPDSHRVTGSYELYSYSKIIRAHLLRQNGNQRWIARLNAIRDPSDAIREKADRGEEMKSKQPEIPKGEATLTAQSFRYEKTASERAAFKSALDLVESCRSGSADLMKQMSLELDAQLTTIDPTIAVELSSVTFSAVAQTFAEDLYEISLADAQDVLELLAQRCSDAIGQTRNLVIADLRNAQSVSAKSAYLLSLIVLEHVGNANFDRAEWEALLGEIFLQPSRHVGRYDFDDAVLEAYSLQQLCGVLIGLDLIAYENAVRIRIGSLETDRDKAVANAILDVSKAKQENAPRICAVLLEEIGFLQREPRPLDDSFLVSDTRMKRPVISYSSLGSYAVLASFVEGAKWLSPEQSSKLMKDTLSSLNATLRGEHELWNRVPKELCFESAVNALSAHVSKSDLEMIAEDVLHLLQQKSSPEWAYLARPDFQINWRQLSKLPASIPSEMSYARSDDNSEVLFYGIMLRLLASKISEETLNLLAEDTFKSMAYSEHYSSSRLRGLSIIFASSAIHLSDERAAQMGEEFLIVAGPATSLEDQASFLGAFNAVAPKISDEKLIEYLKWPTCVELFRYIVLKEFERRFDQTDKFQSVWELVAWLKTNKPNLYQALQKPPNRPEQMQRKQKIEENAGSSTGKQSEGVPSRHPEKAQ